MADRFVIRGSFDDGGPDKEWSEAAVDWVDLRNGTLYDSRDEAEVAIAIHMLGAGVKTEVRRVAR